MLKKPLLLKGHEFSRAIQADCSLFSVISDGRHSPASISPAILLVDGVPREAQSPINVNGDLTTPQILRGGGYAKLNNTK
jgi:hypothetical protein